MNVYHHRLKLAAKVLFALVKLARNFMENKQNISGETLTKHRWNIVPTTLKHTKNTKASTKLNNYYLKQQQNINVKLQ